MDGRPVDLARARREAKALLRAARAGDAAARARMARGAARADPARCGSPTRSWRSRASSAPAAGPRSCATRRRAMARGERARTLRGVGDERAPRRRRGAARARPGARARQRLDAALVLGDAERVRAALAGDPGVARRAFGARGWEPLLYVTHSAFLGGERTDGLVACARLLLAAGADPDDGRSLRGAAGAEDPACLELLLDAGARVQGAMALAHAAAARTRCARRGCCSSAARGEWGERENALQWAVRAEASAEMVRLLVEHGADLEASFDGTGRTPYGVAVRSGRPDLAELLASLGARRRAEPLDELIGACLAGDGATARRLAAEHPDAARLLRTAEAGRPRRAGRPTGAARPWRSCSTSACRSTPAGPPASPRCRRRPRCDGRRPRRPAPRARRRPAPSARREDAPRRRRAALRRARLGGASAPTCACSPPPRWPRRRPCGDGVAVAHRRGLQQPRTASSCSRLDARRRRDDRRRRCAGSPSATRRRSGCSPIRSRRPTCASASSRPARAPSAPPWSWAPCSTAWRSTIRRRPGSRSRPCATPPRCARGRQVVEPAEPRARALEVLAEPRPRRRRAAAASPRASRRRGRSARRASCARRDGPRPAARRRRARAPRRASGARSCRRCAREALAAGARVAVVAPTPDTVAFYRLLGFALRPWPRDRSFYLPTAR